MNPSNSTWQSNSLNVKIIQLENALAHIAISVHQFLSEQLASIEYSGKSTPRVPLMLEGGNPGSDHCNENYV